MIEKLTPSLGASISKHRKQQNPTHLNRLAHKCGRSDWWQPVAGRKNPTTWWADQRAYADPSTHKPGVRLRRRSYVGVQLLIVGMIPPTTPTPIPEDPIPRVEAFQLEMQSRIQHFETKATEALAGVHADSQTQARNLQIQSECALNKVIGNATQHAGQQEQSITTLRSDLDR